MADYNVWDIGTGQGVSDYELHERYDDMLDDVFGEVSIAGYEYSTSRALKAVDPIAYRVCFGDWLDSKIGETLTETQPTDDDSECRAMSDYYVEATVVVGGAVDTYETFDSFGSFVRWLDVERAELERVTDEPIEVYVLEHEHALEVDYCECVQYLTDHRPYWDNGVEL